MDFEVDPGRVGTALRTEDFIGKFRLNGIWVMVLGRFVEPQPGGSLESVVHVVSSSKRRLRWER